MNDRKSADEEMLPMGLPVNADNWSRDRSCGAGVPLIGISRHRFGVDGKGITTLVAFHGCELRCKYCLNPQCFWPADNLPRYTPENLYAELQKDDLYFRATGGGVTFGGGEPCRQADFIVRFREICGPDWKINVETSLNVDRELVAKLAPVVDEWIVDIKTDDPAKYLEYTDKEMHTVRHNLYYLIHAYDVSPENILIRIPVIPGLVTREEAEATRRHFECRHYTRFDIFSYLTETPEKVKEDGKAKCEILREIREEIAGQNSTSTLPPQHCTHEGDCPGTCPRCESELKTLSQELRQNGDSRKLKISEDLAQRIENHSITSGNDKESPLKGDAEAPPELYGQIVCRPEEVYKKIFFKECPIAGLSFHLEKDDDLWFELEEGTQLALVRDRNNKHDRNAVAVALADDYDGNPDDFDFDFILGYIPRSENTEIAAMMDAGYADKFSAEITTFRQYGSYNDRIRITVYIESLKPVVQRPDLLRAQWLDGSEYDDMIAKLKNQGFAVFRWGGFPPEENNLPESGDKIVMIHEGKKDIILHLMHVLMKGEDCLKLGLDQDEIFAVDDCIHFALTNVVGPLPATTFSLDFLSKTDLSHYSIQNYLTPKESDTFKKIFNISHAISR